MRYPLALAVAALGFAAILAAPVAAQEASPQAAGVSGGEVVDPAECRIQAPTVESLTQLVGTSAAEAARTPELAGSPSPFAMPEGAPADAATVEAVTATYRELVGCLNGGDLLRPFALYTENYLRRTITPDRLQTLGATPVAMEAPVQVAFRGVRQAVALPDGRVAALIDLANEATGVESTVYAILARVGDRWLIDEETVIEAAAPGTPVS